MNKQEFIKKIDNEKNYVRIPNSLVKTKVLKRNVVPSLITQNKKVVLIYAIIKILGNYGEICEVSIKGLTEVLGLHRKNYNDVRESVKVLEGHNVIKCDIDVNTVKPSETFKIIIQICEKGWFKLDTKDLALILKGTQRLDRKINLINTYCYCIAECGLTRGKVTGVIQKTREEIGQSIGINRIPNISSLITELNDLGLIISDQAIYVDKPRDIYEFSAIIIGVQCRCKDCDVKDLVSITKETIFTSLYRKHNESAGEKIDRIFSKVVSI